MALVYGGALEASNKDTKLPADLTNDSRSTLSVTPSSTDKKEEGTKKSTRSLTKPFSIPYTIECSSGTLSTEIPVNFIEIIQKTINVRVELDDRDEFTFDYAIPIGFPLDLMNWIGLNVGDPSKLGFGCLESRDGKVRETLMMSPEGIKRGLSALQNSMGRELLTSARRSSSASSSTSSSSSSSSSSVSLSSAPLLVFSSSSSLTSETPHSSSSSLSAEPSSSSVSVSTGSSLLSPKAVLLDEKTTPPSVFTLFYIEGRVKAMGGTTKKEYRKKNKLSHLNVNVNGRTQTFHASKNGKALKEQLVSFLKEVAK